MWEGEPPGCDVESSLQVYTTEDNQNANGGGPVPGHYSDAWDWDFDNNGFPETRKGGEGCMTWWDGRGGFNNEWNQCESGVCRDYTVYKKTSIWFVAPADGGYSPMRPADENTENNMGKVCTIMEIHACKGPGGKADAYCHAGDIKGTAESAEKAQCEAITSATSLTGASKTLEIIGGEPSKSYTLVGWYPSADACMNSMANDISFDKWTYFAYGWGNKCNSNGDCKCYAFLGYNKQC